MANRVVTDGGRTGIPNLWDIKQGTEWLWFNRLAFIGFIGKNLESAEYLLREASKREGTADAARFRDLANKIITTQIAIDQSPPTSEGVKLNDGAGVFFPKGDVCYLRVYSDDLTALLRAYQFEKSQGRDRPAWLAWAKDFSDWLLTQQAWRNGSFPRAWNCGASTSKGTVYYYSEGSFRVE